jgi:hypothetical protein
MNTTVGTPVPSILWDAFTDVMEANTLRLAKEIAQSLGVSHLPLMTAIRAKKNQPYIVEFSNDERDIDLRCDCVCQRGCLIQVCNLPILWIDPASKRCPEHLYSKPLLKKLPTIVRPTSDPELFLADSEGTGNGTLYTASAGRVGCRHSGKIFMFDLEVDQ